MPNWCSNYLEVKSEAFAKDCYETLNYDKIAHMMFLIMKMPAVLGHDQEKINTIIMNFGEKDANLENLEKLEHFFKHFFPSDILESDAAAQTFIDQAQQNSFGGKIQPKILREIINGPNLIKLENPDFSLFNFVTRPMKLFVSEQFQFSLTNEEEEMLSADVIGNNNAVLGTKWDAGDVDIMVEDDETIIRFNTAWSPPTPVIGYIADKYPDAFIKHVYAELGCAYCGQTEFENGEETLSIESDFMFCEPEDAEEEEIDNAFNDIDNWSFDDNVEIHLLNGNYGG